MNKTELIEQLREEHTDISKGELGDILDSVFGKIMGAVANDGRVAIAGFGTFVESNRKARTGINPQTKKPLEIPASRSVRFKPAPAFKAALE